jgi:type VI secretion system secreted protein VgrG
MLALMGVSLFCPSAAFAGAITLGSAQSFAVLGGAGVTVAGGGSTVISGNLGDYPYTLSSITGFPPGEVVNGSIYAADNNPGPAPGIADQAQLDENTAYNALKALSPGASESGTIGNGSTLTPGTYTFSSSAEVDGTLNLNFEGESNAMFVFQIGSTLTTGSSAVINVTGANSTDAIYWQVGSEATLGSSTIFAGNILASTAITLGSSASIACGRAFASTASVTMDGSNFISDNCSLYNIPSGLSLTGLPTDFGSYGFSGVPAASTPEPGTFLLLGFGLAGVAVVSRKYSARGR